MSTRWDPVTLQNDRAYLDCYQGHTMSRLSILKGIIYAIVMGIVAIVGIVENGNATYIVLSFLLGALLIFGVEINTIAIGDFLKIDFTESEEGDDEN